MATMEQIAFTMISTSGDAQTMMMNAIAEARKGDFIQSDKLMKQAEGLLLKAHKEQTELIKNESTGTKYEFSILLVHAQDHLMNARLSKQLITEMIMLYKELKS